MIINVQQLASGRFKVGAIRGDGVYEDRSGWFDNLIVDTGLNFLGTDTAANATQYCGAGTGSTAPANAQTTLVSPLGSRSGVGTSVVTTSGGSPVWYQSLTRVYTFAIGAVVGNVAELATFNATTGGVMFSRALVKDGAGDPTTIAVFADEQLVVTYELRKYPPAADVTGTASITVNGTPTNYDYTIRAANVDGVSSAYWEAARSFGNLSAAGSGAAYAYETQTLGAVVDAPAGTSSSSTSASVASYSPGSFYRDTTLTWAISAGNFASGIGAIAFAQPVSTAGSGNTGYQISFTPRLPKDATKTISLTFRVSWGRYAP